MDELARKRGVSCAEGDQICPDHCVAERQEMRSLDAKLRVLATRIADDGLKYLALIERTDDGGNHVHQLELLPFHIVGE